MVGRSIKALRLGNVTLVCFFGMLVSHCVYCHIVDLAVLSVQCWYVITTLAGRWIWEYIGSNGFARIWRSKISMCAHVLPRYPLRENSFQNDSFCLQQRMKIAGKSRVLVRSVRNCTIDSRQWTSKNWKELESWHGEIFVGSEIDCHLPQDHELDWKLVLNHPFYGISGPMRLIT